MRISALHIMGGVALLALGHEAAAAGFKVNAFYRGRPLADASVVIDNEMRGVTSAKGVLLIEGMTLGSHQGTLEVNGKKIPFKFDLQSDDQIAVLGVAVDDSGNVSDKLSMVTASEVEDIVGTLKGRILSAETDDPVGGVIISILGTGRTVTSNRAGDFELELPHGQYTLQLEHPQYASQRVQNIQVMPGLSASLDLNIQESMNTGAIEEVSVIARYVADNATVNMREASTIINMIDSEQLARFGDSTAAEALRRVSGVSLQENKYVQVRGMSGRYVATTLNGARLPSTDVLQRVVPMDMFPTSVMDRIEVQKSFSPDHFGEGGAGAVNLVTRGIPDEPFVKLKSDFSYNDQVTGEQVISHEGGDKDWLGYDDDTRKMPKEVSSWLSSAPNDQISNRDPSVVARDLAIKDAFLQPRYTEAEPDGTLELAAGSSWQMGNTEFGYVVGARYKNSWDLQLGEEGRYEVVVDPKTQQKEVKRIYDADYERGRNNTALSALLALGLKIGENHEFTSNTLALRNSNKTTKSQLDADNPDNRFYSVSIDWEEREILGQQFYGKHFFPTLKGLESRWQVTWSEASREVPNAWDYEFEAPNDDRDPYQPYQLKIGSGSLDRPQVYWQDMEDENLTLGLDFSLPFGQEGTVYSQLKWGGSLFRRDRDVDSDEWYVNSCPAEVTQGTDDITEVLGACDWIYFGIHGEDDRNPTKTGDEPGQAISHSSYIGSWDMDAYYLMADTRFYNVLDVFMGLRWEDSEMEITKDFSAKPELKTTTLSYKNKMPTAAITWHVLDDLQLRLAYSRTYTLPDFVEVANSRIRDPFSDGYIYGNTDLEQTRFINYDARLEWYLSPSESISLAVFKKEITDAIEKVIRNSESFSYDNYDGENKGYELEMRKEFDLDSLQKHKFFVQANYGWIESEVEVDEFHPTRPSGPRPLVDQPDTVANLQLGYDHVPSSQDVTVMFNYVGEKLEAVSEDKDLPHIYQQPYLDVRLKYNLNFFDAWKISATISNLLDEEKEFLQGEDLYRRYKTGREYKIGFSYQF